MLFLTFLAAKFLSARMNPTSHSWVRVGFNAQPEAGTDLHTLGLSAHALRVSARVPNAGRSIIKTTAIALTGGKTCTFRVRA